LVKKIAIISLWRDSCRYIETSLNQLEMQEKSLSKDYLFTYSFYENDSKDETPRKLKDWIEGKNGRLISRVHGLKKWGSVNSTNRTKQLSYYRNRCLQFLSCDSYEYVFIVDSDIEYSQDLFSKMVYKMDMNKTIGMLTANTIQNVNDIYNTDCKSSYFDSWALIDLNGNQSLTYSSNPFLRFKDRKRWNEAKQISVNSAFGGIAIIRGSLIKNKDLEWNGDNGCEHWYFCEKIRSYGYSVIVDPLLMGKVNHIERVRIDPLLACFDKARLSRVFISKRSDKKSFLKIRNKISLFMFGAILNIKRYLANNLRGIIELMKL